MKIYKSKIMKVINFIKNEGKFEFGDMVRVKELKKDLGEDNFYAKYQGQLGIVTSISYNKKDFVFGVKFEDGNRIDFRSNELEKLSLENQIKYRNLKIDY